MHTDITIPENVLEVATEFIMDKIGQQLDDLGLTSDFQLQCDIESSVMSAAATAYSSRRLELSAMGVDCNGTGPYEQVTRVLVTAEGYPALTGLVMHGNTSEFPSVWCEHAQAQEMLDTFAALNCQASVQYDDDADAFTYFIAGGWSGSCHTQDTLVAVHAVGATLHDPSGDMTNADRALTVYQVLPDKEWKIIPESLQDLSREVYLAALESCRVVLADAVEQPPLNKYSRRTATLLSTVADMIIDAD